MDRIYLDHNATTRPDQSVREAIDKALADNWGNPSSFHWQGQRAAAMIEESRESVAAMLGADPGEVYFTSGGTEANNLAVFGSVLAKGRGRVITSTIEHPSVRSAVRSLSDRGFEVVEAPVDAGGRVMVDAVREELTDDTVLVSIMAANNETGVVQPFREIGEMARERGVRFHVDAVQYAGKLPISVRSWPADLVSISGHKFHGPKGAAALWVRKGVKLEARQIGGGQEGRVRSGTENTPGIAGLGAAARLVLAKLPEWEGRIAGLRGRLEKTVIENVPGAVINGDRENRVPNTTNISFPGAEGEAVMINLDLKGVAVSTGSACNTGANEPSHVLLAMNLSARQCETAIRFSLGKDNTAEQIERAAQIVAEAVEKVRSIAGVTVAGPGS